MANFHGTVLFCLALSMMATASAKEFQVGGSMGWSVPGPNAMSYNQWAESNRFQIGDSLRKLIDHIDWIKGILAIIRLFGFVYPPHQDSVLQVDKDGYDTCSTTTYIQKFDDGNTVFTFNRSGAFYFISRNEANCLKNESMVVVVLAERSNRASPPSPSPVSSLSPPSSPASSSPPSPPPSSSTEVTPSSAPAGVETTTPPPNGAPFKVVGFMGSLGAFLGWVLLVF